MPGLFGGYSYYEWMKILGATDALIAAVDILDDHELLDERRLEVLIACERSGECPEAFARGLVTSCRAAEEDPAMPLDPPG